MVRRKIGLRSGGDPEGHREVSVSHPRDIPPPEQEKGSHEHEDPWHIRHMYEWKTLSDCWKKRSGKALKQPFKWPTVENGDPNSSMPRTVSKGGRQIEVQWGVAELRRLKESLMRYIPMITRT
ncbi:hypothetical protein Salat_2655400 [Sesamum alatum]|uniref:Uncharacterized protein n=1 Tax=Sesamum alatum TaxID=300844 RepID=A0AAE1XP42_9LAMI|nr:hypothetical protein Salat_2655400 [Sesamum alatum]